MHNLTIAVSCAALAVAGLVARAEAPKDAAAPLKFGPPVKLLAEGLEGFEGMDDNDPEDSWCFEDGVLANSIKRTLDGRVIPGVNLISKRADFLDFKLDYDVRVHEECDAGVFLRGRYEIVSADSVGKPLGKTSMGALRGLVAPSADVAKKAGAWQHVTATLAKGCLTVVVDGKTVIENHKVGPVTADAIDKNGAKSGPIVLRGNRSDVDYRNLVLCPVL